MHWVTCIEGGPRRVNHAAVAVDEYIYSFGGYCVNEDSKENRPMDVHILNTKTFRWSRIVNRSNYDESLVPFKRYGHTAVTYKEKIYIWGGRNDEGACNILYCFDPDTKDWSRPKVTGVRPGARDGHSASVYGKFMYIFSGYEEMLDCLSTSVYVLDMDKMHWSFLKTTGCPPKPRDFHTALVLNDRMYVFGGRSNISEQFNMEVEWYCDELFYLDLKSSVWTCLTNINNKPIGRRSHSAFAFNNKMYIFGGYNGHTRQHFNELYEFNPETATWTLTKTHGTSPCERRRQVCVVIDARLYLFGGTSPSPLCRKYESYADYITDYDIDTKLTDHSDLHILDFTPSLKMLSIIAVKKYRLDNRELPKSLSVQINNLTSSSIISTIKLQNLNLCPRINLLNS